MVMLDRLMAGISGMHRKISAMLPVPRIETGPGRRIGPGGESENGDGSTERHVYWDVGITSGPGSPVGKSGIGASIGAPGMGLRVIAIPLGKK
jgi:hypothetical protein